MKSQSDEDEDKALVNRYSNFKKTSENKNV